MSASVSRVLTTALVVMTTGCGLPQARAQVQQVATDGGGPRVQLKARLDKPVLLAGEKNRVFLKVGLEGFAAKSSERAAVNVAIVLDKSGSMSGAKITKAKEAAIMAVERLSKDDIVSVITYDNTVRVVVHATKVRDRTSIRKAIERVRPGGNTALFAGVSKGADELRKFFEKNRFNRVILLSDGLANVGPSTPGDLERLGASLIREGMSVTTIGLGLDYNEDLMSRLARASDGNHAFVEHASDLARFFNLEFGDVLSVVAQDLTIKIDCAPGVRPVRVLGRDADIVGQQVITRLNQLYSRREKFILLELEVPPGETGSARAIAEVTVSYSNMATKSGDTLKAGVAAHFTTSAADVARALDKDVSVKAIALIANERNQAAVVLRDQGRIQEAEKVLFDNATFLETNFKRYGDKSLDSLKNANLDDARNLKPKHWKRQRKKMRRSQYKLDQQQSY